VGSNGRVLGLDHFGASGKGPDLFTHFGITSAAVKALVEQILS
jgi:transketolase